MFKKVDEDNGAGKFACKVINLTCQHFCIGVYLHFQMAGQKKTCSSDTKYCTLSESSRGELVSRCLNVNSDGTWTLVVHGQQVNHSTCTPIHSIPLVLPEESAIINF